MDVGNKKDRPTNPRAQANIFEIFTYSWLLNLFRIGQKRDLEVNDLYVTLNDHRSSTLGSKLEKEWTIELDNARKTNREPSLFRVLFRMFGSTFILYGSIQTFVEVVLRVSQPILIGKLLNYFNNDGSNTTDLKQAYIYASSLLLTILGNILLFHHAQLELAHCGMKIRIACCSVIFKKALRLSKTSLGETTVGQIVNLLSNDVIRFEIAMRFVQFLWIGPLGTSVVLYFLWQEIGPSSLVGVAGILIVIPLQGWLGKKTSYFRKRTAPRTDERVRLMNEIISGIQVIKMYTWEKPFASLVRYARKMEIKELRGSLYIGMIVTSFKIFHIRFVLFISILSYVLLGNHINTYKVYVIISLYNVLTSTMTVFFPQAITQAAEVLVTIKRIQNFLLRDEKEKVPSLKSENTTTNDIQMSTVKSEGVILNDFDDLKDEEDIKQLRNFGIVVSNVFAKWTLDQPDHSLNNINLMVRPSRLVAIIGPVGAGKSSLIQAILRELPLSNGKIFVSGVVSYAPQEPWLFNSSVQQNILFGSPMDVERYNQILQVCALKPDLKQFPYGDKTIVGERGVSLSGGQRARINLARAVYKRADIYLLDDPLSAVDTHVGKHLFEKCIKGFLKEKTCILITHQIQYLRSVDQIVLMENAKILVEGSYQELQSSGLNFTKSLGSSEEIVVTSTDEKPRDINETSLNSSGTFSTLSRQGSVCSVSSAIGESCKLDETRAEPKEIAESSGSGSVSCGIYFSYMSACGSLFKVALLLFICLFTQFLGTGGDYWINYWVDLEENVFKNETEKTENSTSAVQPLLWWSISRQTCVTVYAILTVSLIVVVFIRAALFVLFFMNVSTNLHNDMFDSIARATMYFFNTNSSGRILNRFTKDMGIIDEAIPIPLTDFIFTVVLLLGVFTVVGYINIYLMIPTFVIGVLCYQVVVFYLSTSRSVKRLEGVVRSPVFAHFNASLQGLTTIRAFEAEDILSEEFDIHQDLHSSAWYIFISSSEALGFTLDMISLVYMSIVTYSFLIMGNDYFAGDVGLVITQTIMLTGGLQWGIRQAAEMENQMTSVERVLEYMNVPQEAALESSCPDKKPPKEWPNNGQIVFKNLSLRYSLDTPHVLKNLNIIIQPMEKIGIVGRTGAGKSSLIGALFRLALNEGYIIIDDIEIDEIGLHELRSKLSIIPQEPILFSGTMRKNLDPFDEYPDHALWNALDDVELKNVVEDLPDGLNSQMSEGGSNFSVGQRQLVCLARAILRCNKILVLDEATANVDSQTDALIQNTIRNKFRKCTVLTIAHRLNTIMDSDKVLVMDSGTIIEFDHPHNLLQNEDGHFYKMVEQTGQATANLLHNVATENFKTMKMNKEFPIKLIDEDAETT